MLREDKDRRMVEHFYTLAHDTLRVYFLTVALHKRSTK